MKINENPAIVSGMMAALADGMESLAVVVLKSGKAESPEVAECVRGIFALEAEMIRLMGMMAEYAGVREKSNGPGRMRRPCGAALHSAKEVGKK